MQSSAAVALSPEQSQHFVEYEVSREKDLGVRRGPFPCTRMIGGVGNECRVPSARVYEDHAVSP